MVFSKEKKIKELSGHSGCSILLYKKEKEYFVRKISKSRKYNFRLKKQMNKQKFFYLNLTNEDISCPRVLREGYINDLFYFDMEYIKGMILTEYIFHSDITKLKKIANDLLNMINLFEKTEVNKQVDLKKETLYKIKSLKKEILDAKFLILLEKLEKKSKNLPSLRETFCHGDLTLENIIYDENNKKYYLIDFQDLFANHYWFDISNLFQDIEESWYLLRYPHLDPKTMKIKMDFLNKNISSKLNRGYLLYHNFFMAMKFFRIVPYASEENKEYLFMVIFKNLQH